MATPGFTRSIADELSPVPLACGATARTAINTVFRAGTGLVRSDRILAFMRQHR